MYGTKMLRLDFPARRGEDGWTTRFCGGPSLYQFSPSGRVALDAIKRQPTRVRSPHRYRCRSGGAYDAVRTTGRPSVGAFEMHLS